MQNPIVEILSIANSFDDNNISSIVLPDIKETSIVTITEFLQSDSNYHLIRSAILNLR